jgi:dCMP deaminase
VRPEKDLYYLKLALDAASRSTCLKRNYGAVIVKDDHIVSTGYNGAPRGRVNCSDIGCPRMNVAHNTEYSTCRSVHAEANAIIHANYSDMIGSTLYLSGSDCMKENQTIKDAEPCPMCKRMIINAQIDRVVVYDELMKPKIHYVKDWVLPCNDDSIQKKESKPVKEELKPETTAEKFLKWTDSITPSSTLDAMIHQTEFLVKTYIPESMAIKIDNDTMLLLYCIYRDTVRRFCIIHNLPTVLVEVIVAFYASFASRCDVTDACIHNFYMIAFHDKCTYKKFCYCMHRITIEKDSMNHANFIYSGETEISPDTKITIGSSNYHELIPAIRIHRGCIAAGICGELESPSYKMMKYLEDYDAFHPYTPYKDDIDIRSF